MTKQASAAVRPYSDVKWDGKTAFDVYIEGKAAAMRALQQQINAIDDLSFDDFARDQCARGAGPETVRRG